MLATRPASGRRALLREPLDSVDLRGPQREHRPASEHGSDHAPEESRRERAATHVHLRSPSAKPGRIARSARPGRLTVRISLVVAHLRAVAMHLRKPPVDEHQSVLDGGLVAVLVDAVR